MGADLLQSTLAVSYAQHQYCCIAHGMMTTCHSHDEVGVNLYATLEFWTFFILKVKVPTYMQIGLYAGIYGMPM